MKKQMVGEVPDSVSGMIANLAHKLQCGAITPQQLRKFLKKKNSFIAEWKRFFWEIHKTKVDFAGIDIPEADSEYSWFVCIPEDFSTERSYSGGKEQYSKCKIFDKSLDDVLDLSFGRDAWNHPYIIRLQPNWEADEDLRNLSANKIIKKGIDTATLRERLLLGDFLYWKHEKYIDSESWTFCAGSRLVDSWVGWVPGVRWDGRCHEINIRCFRPGNRLDFLRARRVMVS